MSDAEKQPVAEPILQKETLPDSELIGVEISNSEPKDVQISDSDSKDVQISDSADTKDVQISDSADTKDVQISDSAVTNDVPISDSDAKVVQIFNSDLRDVQITNVHSIDVQISNADSTDVQISSADPKDVETSNSDPKGVEISNSDSKDVDIPKSEALTDQNDAIGVEIKTEIASPAPSERVPQDNDENTLDFEHEPVDGTDNIVVKEEPDEDGLCTPEQDTKNKEQEPKDDGECSEGGDEDLEDGEINEDNEEKKDGTNSKSNTSKQLCRFYSRGQCFFGSNCRFQHINSASGNYNMFAPSTPAPRACDYYSSHGGMLSHRSGPLPPRSSGSDFLPPVPASPQPALEESASAWEKGLETARQLVRKANKRKIEEGPDYSEKSLNLSLTVNEKNVPEFLDNDTSYQKRKRDKQFPKYDEPLDNYDHYDTKNSYRAGYDSFDVRYHREDRRGGDRSRDRMDRDPRDKREYRPKSPSRSKERFKGYDRLQEVEPPRRDANAYFDPWRRSKSPKGAARRSRSRSYSSVSSYSWSDKSFSSNSYSRSSRSSSRSPPHQKRKPSPTITNAPFAPSGPLLANTFTTMKKKPEGRGGVSSSRSRTPSRSRSRSFSRSISMSSVSSASSRDSLSHSSGSLSRRQNSSSILRKQDENPTLPVGKTVDPTKVSGPAPASVPLPSMHLNYPSFREKEVIQTIASPAQEESEIDPLEEQFLNPKIVAPAPVPAPFPSLQHLLPNYDKPKEPPKVAPHKPLIKLTLLNKNPQQKMNSMPKPDNNDPSKSAGFYFGARGPSSPPMPPPAVPRPTPVLIPKKSASSRRDELLKQLKAVEDAIARKRAKFG